MGFLAPALLLGALAAAVPVWLHLIRRPPDRRQPFPSLRFLREAPLDATRRRSIRDPLLLALRVLALILLAGAFSRPYLNPGVLGENAETGVREVVLLVDRSYSMASGDRMARAREAARAVFAELAEGDRLTLVAFDATAEVLGPATRDVPALEAALDSVRVGEDGTSYAAALRLAESILAASPGPRREVVVVSDFLSERPNREAVVELPAGTRIRYEAVEGGAVTDLAVTDVSLRREGFAAGERVRAVARLRNTGDVAADGRTVTLSLDGARVAAEPVSLEPGSSATVTFPPFSVASGAAAGAVRLDGDDVAPNDVRYFIAEPRRSMNVLIVEPDGTGPRRGLHARRALELGRDPTFALRRRTTRSLRPEDFGGVRVVILDGIPFPEGETGARLRAFVEAGGGLLLAHGESSGGGVPAAAEGLIAEPDGRPVSRGGGGTLASIEYGHPVFAPFRDPGSGDLGGARFSRYRPVHPDGSRVLARFDDGAPALLEAEAGLGRVLVWTTSLGDAWTDLPLHPVYLPLLHRMVLHAAAWDEEGGSRTVGASIDAAALIAADAVREEPAVLVLPGGLRRDLEPTNGPIPLERAGVYEIRDPAAADIVRFAVNVDPEEAGTTPVDTAGLARVDTSARPEAAAEATREPVEVEREPGPPLWWPLLAAAGVLFVVESVLSNAVAGRATIGGTQ